MTNTSSLSSTGTHGTHASPVISRRRLVPRMARGLFLDRQLAFWRKELGLAPAGLTRARVVAVVKETADVRTFLLRPGAGWRRHQAGQWVSLEVEVDGVRLRRCYSLSSGPSDLFVSITVKRVPGGRVSGWLHDNVRVGDMLSIGPAMGEFVLPETGRSKPTPPTGLLLLSGGSGVTPVMSILRELEVRGPIEDVVFVHHARSRADVPFAADLAWIARRNPGLRVIIHCDDEGVRGFDEARFTEAVPDFARRETYLCGPAPMMVRVEETWLRAGATAKLRRERFAAPIVTRTQGDDEKLVQVRLSAAGRTVTAGGEGNLLEQLERAGLTPKFGCRIGICQTCKCRKTSGTVLDLISGAISSEPDEDIRLCTSVARSDLELGL